MSEENTVEVPVLEIEFDTLLEMVKKINLVDCITLFSMPNHLKVYGDSEKTSIGNLMMELVEYQNEENSWRLEKHIVKDFSIENNSIKILDKAIFDTQRIIIVSKMNSIFIIPGENSIKNGNCLPNQIIKLSNLISSQLFLLRLNDVKDKETGKFNLQADFAMIERNFETNKDENSNQK